MWVDPLFVNFCLLFLQNLNLFTMQFSSDWVFVILQLLPVCWGFVYKMWVMLPLDEELANV